ncbi:MAG: hypothetical protein U5K36_01840 [Roseovarius sp.]|nr:hypothetical protein [Roseovarius sp.]
MRLTRADFTPGCASSARSIFEMQAEQWIVGSDSAIRASGSARAASASAAGAAEQAGQAEGVARAMLLMGYSLCSTTRC